MKRIISQVKLVDALVEAGHCALPTMLLASEPK